MTCLASVGESYAQGRLNPQQEQVQFRIQALRVEGFDEESHFNVRNSDLTQQIALERGRFGDTVTVSELHQVADALTLFFRRKGYSFHSVYLPPQKVSGGLVVLKLRVGVLSDVHVINQTQLKDSRFSGPFKHLKSKLLYSPHIEQAVQAVKMQAGLQVFAFFSRGANPGEARLNLRVQPSSKRSFEVKADNYGSETSGKNRLSGTYTEYQLTGHHDVLSLSLMRVVDDISNTYGGVYYKLPFAGLRYELTASASSNQFEVGDYLSNLDFRGDTFSYTIGISRYFDFHPQTRSTLQLYLSNKRSELAPDGQVAVYEETSQSANLGWQKRLQGEGARWMLHSNLELSTGQYENLGDTASESFARMSFSEFFMTGFSQQRTRNVLQFNLRGQYSRDELPVAESLPITGVYGAKGYVPSTFNADRGAILSTEWRWPNVFMVERGRWHIEPYLHADFAYGEDGFGDLLSRADYLSTGLGLRLNFGKHVSAQLTYAQGVQGQIDEVEVDDDKQVWFEIRWH